MFTSYSIRCRDEKSDEMANDFFLVTRQEVNDGYFNHGVASRCAVHGGTSDTNEDLCGERRVVDAHVELKELVLGCSTDALAGQIHAVSHVNDVIH